MTTSVQLTREESEDVTHLHELHEKALRGKRDVASIVEIEKLIIESSEEIEPTSQRNETGVSLSA